MSHDAVIELVNFHSKQYHILKELLETERVYVQEMKTIVTVCITFVIIAV